MRNLLVVILFIGLFSACSNSVSKEAQLSDSTNTGSSIQEVSESSNPPDLGPVSPKLKLNKRQQKYLDESIPPEVRKILENATKFQLVAEVDVKWTTEAEMMSLNPNRQVKIDSDELKLKILEAFYWDAARETGGANCYEPRHGIIASIDDQLVEIDICFECAKFNIKVGAENYWGTIEREGRTSDKLFTSLINDKGTVIQGL